MRRRLREARRALTESERARADAAIRAQVRALPAFRSARRIALFFAFDGEPDLGPLLRFDRGKELFLPVITRTEMGFASIGPRTALVTNFFGIPEPADPELIDPRALDLVLTPLVAFDGRGNRVGVGAGYYDRCFKFLLGRRRWHRPKLVGCGYALQRVGPLEPDPWDVPLWGAITEDGFEAFH